MFEKFKKKEGWLWKTYHEIDTVSVLFDKHHLFMFASGIAFNIALYLIPMFLVAIYMINIFVDANELTLILEKAMRDFMPPTTSSSELIHTIVVEIRKINMHSSVAGLIGIFSLLWISSLLISSFRSALNGIFEITEEKFFLFYRMTDILLTLVLTVLILIYSYVVPMLNFIIIFLNDYMPAFLHGLVSNLLLMSLTLGTSFVLFFFVFRFIPTKRLPLFVSFYSTVACVVMIELARNIFGWYISSFSDYGKFYGTYAVLISMAIWIYYSSFILLASSEVVNYIYCKREKRKKDEAAKELDIA